MSGMSTPPAAATPDLKTLVASVLEDLASLLADEQPAQTSVDTRWLEAEVTYEGTARGVLRCWCTHGLAEKLAANLLAVEPDEDAARAGAGDALREFLNVLCGQLVTSWHGPRGIYNLSIPTVRPCTEAPAAHATATNGLCRLSVEGEIIVCAWERR